MRISFCTTCMGRLHHLKETLPANLKTSADRPDLEFVVLDYNSKDGLEEWMRREMAQAVTSGRVAYYRERAARFFDPRHAKNIAHLMATGDILVNVDADNFIGPGYAGKLEEFFGSPGVFVTSDPGQTKLKEGSAQLGISGRIALRAADFKALRGYDEGLVGWGGEDPDLNRRARARGLRQISLYWPGDRVIPHCNEERTRHFEVRLSIDVTSAQNRRRSIERRLTEVVNPSGYGRTVVYAGFGEETIQVDGGLAICGPS